MFATILTNSHILKVILNGRTDNKEGKLARCSPLVRMYIYKRVFHLSHVKCLEMCRGYNDW